MGQAGPRRRAEPFYNPAMALDRDLAVALARAALPPGAAARGWETNAATGVRGLRLLGESGRFVSFRMSESSDRSFPVLKENCRRLAGAEAVHEDARSPALRGERFDYVDVDPYGSPLPYLDAAVAAVAAGGILAVSATDMAVLAGAQRSATRRLYGVEPVRGRLGPEGALRVLVGVLVRRAERLGAGAELLLGYVGEHHVRAFLRLGSRPPGAAPVGLLDPSTFEGPPLGAAVPVGPLWLGPLGDPSVLDAMALPVTPAEPAALRRLLDRLREEVRIDRPFYFEPNELAGRLHLRQPPSVDSLLSALHDAGHPAFRTHVRPEGIRTGAPRAEVERLARTLAENR